MESWTFSGKHDLRRMQDLTTRLWSPTSWWHAGSLAWEILGFMHQHPDWPIRLWGTFGRISAWAFVEPPDRTFIVAADRHETFMEHHLATQVDSSIPGLAEEVVAWFESIAEGGALTARAVDGQPHLTEAYLAAGMAEDETSPFDLDMRCSLDDLPEAAPPPGYAVRTITAEQLTARVGVHRASWYPSSLTETMYAGAMATWPYDISLDIVTVAPNGEFAASCLAWLDPVTGVGTLEPVGTHPDYRGIGAGPAACMAAMHALRAAGATEACVRPRGDDHYPVPRKVYGRLGFKPTNRTRVYRREAK